MGNAEITNHNMEQRSQEWFAARKGRITASAVGGILGLDPYTDRSGVMRRMVREAIGEPNEFTGNIATEYGKNNEAGALIEFEMETGLTVQTVGFVTREDWAGCSPDGLIETHAGLEIKCPFGKRKDAAPVFKTLDEQQHYYAQIQFCMWVTGRPVWEFYQWASGGTRHDSVSVDLEWQAENLPILRQFHAEFLHEVEHNANTYLGPLLASVDTPKAHQMVAEWDQLGEAIDNATARRKELLAEMVAIAGKNDSIFAGRKLTEVARKGSVSYAKAFAKLLPNADLEPFRGKVSKHWRLT